MMKAMETVGELLARLRRGAEVVEAAMAGVSEAELDLVPGPGRWTIRQILAHMVDSEIVGTDRFRRVIAEDNPTLVCYGEKAWAANLDYDRRNPVEDLELFRRTRALNVRLLGSLGVAAFERVGTHTERGKLTLLDLVKIYADHAEGHARQIRGNRGI
jgi:hypothetical protein